jgi:hypothetical protein
MRPKFLLVVVALAVAFTLTAPKTFAQNLLSNGSFETGDFTGWTTGGNFQDTFVENTPFYQYTTAQDGSFYAVLGPVGSDGTLSQTFSDTSGAHYSGASTAIRSLAPAATPFSLPSATILATWLWTTSPLPRVAEPGPRLNPAASS